MSALKNKKVFVTGGTGYVGKQLTKRLESVGAVITVCHIDLLKQNLTSENSGAPEYIFHLAARSPGATDLVSESELVSENVAMTRNVLELARASGAQVLIASSSHVYPPLSGKEHEPLAETAFIPGKALSGFGLSKQETEKIALQYAKEYAIPIVIVRLSNIYGPGDVSNRFVPTFVRKCLAKQFPLEVLGSGETIRDFIFIDDAVEGLLLASMANTFPQILNIGSGRPVSMSEVAECICAATHLSRQPIAYLNPEAVSYNALDSAVAENRFGYKARTPLAAGITQTVAWWQDQKSNL